MRTMLASTVPLTTRSRRKQAGQSAIVAVIVLFLLLFLGAIFIALIANNLRSTQRAANVSQSGRYAEAGINYLDQQLSTSPDGADWRPAPDAITNVQDPDYFWLQPYRYDTQRAAWVGGFSRVNFGGAGAGAGPSGTSGGRALVRVTYRPDAPLNANGNVSPVVSDPLGPIVSPANGQTPIPILPQPINKYIQLESVGRAGQIIPNDPTTFGNSEAVGLRVEQVAYKAIGLNEYVIQATNKDHKPVTAAIGDPSPVIDRGKKREIETVIEGPVRFNTDLTLYGVNRFLLDPTRNDSIEVAGQIHLDGISDTARLATLTNADPTRVYVNTTPANADTGNLVPSGSQDFTTAFPNKPGGATLAGLVRDNPRGSETLGINDADASNRNLRAVGRTEPPLIDAPIGPNGLTRYRVLTRDSPPLSPNDTSTNADINGTGGVGAYAGQYGWGQGLYLPNTGHIQAESEALVGGQSLRSAWLNRDPANPPPYWQNDLKYEPPAVTIILTPRYMILRRPADDNKQGQRGFFFRAPATSGVYTAGNRIQDEEIVRYTFDKNGTAAMQAAPSQGLAGTTLKYGAYPAYAPNHVEGPSTSSSHPNSYSGDFVIFAEGNIRIRGVAGGYDPETDAFFQRHLTVVSGGGNIYVDGNLLRDNINANDTRTGAGEVKGRSTIALLAKNSVVVNTTQFLAPGDAGQPQNELGVPQAPFTRVLNAAQPELNFRVSFGPEDSNNTAPHYVTQTALPTALSAYPAPPKPSLFLRHGATASIDTRAFVQVTLNQPSAATTTVTPANYLPFRFDPTAPATYDPTVTTLPSYADPADTSASTLLLQTAGFTPGTGSTSVPALLDQTFVLPQTYLFGTVPAAQYPYARAVSLIGTENLMAIHYVTNHFSGTSTADYQNTRAGVAPLDIRVEALMYAQEGTFFIIPGAWFNPDPNDTYERFVAGEPNSNAAAATPGGRRAGENTASSATSLPRTSHLFPFYREPMDIRMTFFGAITENLPAEVGDQSAWMEKWGWVPDYYGSTGLSQFADPNYPTPPNAVQTVHGRLGYLRYAPDSAVGTANTATPANGAGGSGIYYQFDSRAVSPYAPVGATGNYIPLRPNPYFPDQPLPLTPRLPVAPGLLYYGQSTQLPQ